MKRLALLAVMTAGCVVPRPNPEPRPTPTPPVCAPLDCLPGQHLVCAGRDARGCPMCTCVADPVETGCPVGVPPLDQYELKGHAFPANPQKWFWSLTPKVHDRDYCAPQVVCPYASEGDPRRDALEKACAYPDLVEGAEMRADHSFAADSATGAHVKFCHGDMCVEGTAVAP